MSTSSTKNFYKLSEKEVLNQNINHTSKESPIWIEKIWHFICCYSGRYEKMQEIVINDNKHMTSTKDSLIYEKCINKMIETIINNESWVNAGLFNAAIINTIMIKSINNASNAWIQFFIVFILGILIAIIPRIFEDLNELKRELALTKKIQEQKIKNINDNNNNNNNNNSNDSQHGYHRKSTVSKILNFVEVEVNDLGEKFEDLLIPTLSNIVALSFNTACINTLDLFTTEGSSNSLTANLFYAILITIIGVFITVRLGSLYEKYEKEIYFVIQDDDITDDRNALLLFAFRTRCIKLSQSLLAFIIAYGWRAATNAFILVIYGKNLDALPHIWTYTIMVTLLTALGQSLSEHFFIFYPKNLSLNHLNNNDQNNNNNNREKLIEEENMFLNSKSRQTINEVFYMNLRVITGIAWFDAVTKTLHQNNDNVSDGLLTFIYWLTAILGISLSVIGTYFIEKYGLMKKINQRGFVQTIFDSFERMYDPNCELHKEGDRDFLPMIFETSIYELIEVIVFAWGITGSIGVTNAVKYSINSSTTTAIHSTGLLSLWMVALIGLFVSTLITAYFGRIITGIRDARKKLLYKIHRCDYDENDGQHNHNSNNNNINLLSIDFEDENNMNDGIKATVKESDNDNKNDKNDKNNGQS